MRMWKIKKKEGDSMKYPKPVMRITELEDMGFPREHLEYCYRKKGQNFAWKLNPTKSNSPIIFDTEEFEKFRLRLIAGKAGL